MTTTGYHVLRKARLCGETTEGEAPRSRRERTRSRENMVPDISVREKAILGEDPSVPATPADVMGIRDEPSISFLPKFLIHKILSEIKWLF